MDYTLALQWLALAMTFLIASIWSEKNVRYGYIITALMAGFFFIIGWIKFPYLTALIPMVIMIAILAYLRTHLRNKFGVFGSSGGLIFKIVIFVIFLQFALVFVNGLAINGIFDTQFGPNVSNAYDSYQISNVDSNFGSFTTSESLTDQVWWGFGMIVGAFKMLWNMVFGFFDIYNTMINIFHMPAEISRIIQLGLYLATMIEIFVIVVKPFRAPEI
jgi:hypothetical protein